jgi:membrane-bound metal-dependent hydrolase YbcI (DUF457 family)
MELVPQVFLDLGHVAPSVHPICFNICNFLLVFFLDGLFSLGILLKIGLFWPFNDNRGDFLGCLDLFDTDVFFEPLLDNL